MLDKKINRAKTIYNTEIPIILYKISISRLQIFSSTQMTTNKAMPKA